MYTYAFPLHSGPSAIRQTSYKVTSVHPVPIRAFVIGDIAEMVVILRGIDVFYVHVGELWWWWTQNGC